VLSHATLALSPIRRQPWIENELIAGVRLTHNFIRFLGVVLVAEAFVLGDGTVNSLSSEHDRANGLTFTQIFAISTAIMMSILALTSSLTAGAQCLAIAGLVVLGSSY